MNESCDFVIIGSGAGALCAAIVMADAGKKVVVLEKEPLLGGTTATSGGVMWIPNNRYMSDAGVPDSKNQAIEYLNHAVGDAPDTPGTSPLRRETYVDQSVAALEFLESQGLEFRRVPSWPDYYAVPGQSEAGRTVVSELFNLKSLDDWQDKLRPGFLPLAGYLEEAMELAYMTRTWAAKGMLLKLIGRTLGSRLTGKNYATAGQALQGAQLKAALNAGADIRTEYAVKELMFDNGKVTGVIAEHKGQPVHITAKLGVLVASGGFSKNQIMLDQYIPGTKTEWSGAASGDTGEMIQEAVRVGATVAQMEQRQGYPVTTPPGKPLAYMQSDLAKPHAILVDKSGQRFMGEADSYMKLARGILERNETSSAIPSWMIIDSQYAKKYMLAGGMLNKKRIKQWLEAGFLKTGATLAELASQCDIDGQQLQASVEQFNGFVTANKDEAFGRGDEVYHNWLGDKLNKPSATLGSITQAPFYAVPIYPGDVSTFGGIVTNEHAQVLSKENQPIPGLYATGVATASVMAKSSPGAGGSIGPSLTWGYVAANHALKPQNSTSRNGQVAVESTVP
ncbi:FAD-dependent oxidoreductase [Halioxenophilus aromaticivorans]|uniref:FAD-binding protein n=1 Tax=Halioxenophilus aromaticivorans TaxID=1306992 RepID=A0AAV3U3V3_9ALTE